MTQMEILVAEDDPTIRRSLEVVLRRLGHEPVVADDGLAAWTLFEQHGMSLVISDWMMPRMNGLELCAKIRAAGRARYTYILLLTALSGKGRYLEGMAAGADDFMTKPFDPDELQARLRVAERILSLQTQVNQLEGMLPI